MNLGYIPLKPNEHHACFVGNGECFIPASHKTDDGAGSVVYMCPLHREEMEQMDKVFKDIQLNDPHKFEQLEAIIEEAHRKETEERKAQPGN